ncbi:MAG: hypothetical protein K2Y16_06820 [Burkholderiales bacterium]|nr:hypothetical protein [Burkholderiales bacterium]
MSDPRHKIVNPYLFRIEEMLACWRRLTAPVLLVTGKDSHVPGWLKDTPGDGARRRALALFPDRVRAAQAMRGMPPGHHMKGLNQISG